MIYVSKRTRVFPDLPYEQMTRSVLGAHYELSLTFIGKRRAQKLNKEYRNATYVPNVLSFPLTDDVGEIYITPVVAEQESKKFNLTRDGYIGYLFIHALLHLKGYLHGDTMEKAEKKYCMMFHIR